MTLVKWRTSGKQLFLKDSGKRAQSSKNSKIHYVLVFDGNSIGRIFTTPLERWEGPNSDHMRRLNKSGQITTQNNEYQRNILP